jgi:hypothetical protein
MELFLILEYEDGSQQQEFIGNVSLEEAKEIAKDALEDAPITYIYPAYKDDKFGTQPAMHFDCIAKYCSKDKTMFNEQANKEYIETQIKIQYEIKKLQGWLDEHNTKAVNINWEHVGDVRYILGQLQELNGKENE